MNTPLDEIKPRGRGRRASLWPGMAGNLLVKVVIKGPPVHSLKSPAALKATLQMQSKSPGHNKVSDGQTSQLQGSTLVPHSVLDLQHYILACVA